MRYSQARFKASHNSYDIEELSITQQLQWSNVNPHHGGCRGLELDLVQQRISRKVDPWQWSVSHGGGYKDDADKQLRHFLKILKTWSQRRPAHDVITLTLDLKRQFGDHHKFPEQFDAYVGKHLGRSRILKPGDVIGNHPDLVRASRAGAWPELKDMKGKFVLCLSGSERRKSAYAAHDPSARLCFADRTREKPPTWGDRACFNFLMPGGKLAANTMIKILRRFADEGFITRAYGLNDSTTWDRGQQAQSTILATDHMTTSKWARAGCKAFEPRDGTRSKHMRC